MTNLPAGWTIRKTRFMYCLCKDGKDRSFALTEEAAANAIHLQPEFYDGITRVVKTDKHVDL